jgi:cell division protein FtsB
MFLRPRRPSNAPPPKAATVDRGDDEPTPDPTDGPDLAAVPAASGVPDLAALPIAGITRRRAAAVVGTMLAVWIVIVFARQVSEASAASNRAEAAASHNIALEIEIAALERELQLIGRQEYIEQQARGYGLGSRREIPFTLADDAPPLGADAPGSAAVRLGATVDRVTPLERWLSMLFGPAD